eukprot:6267790-Pyramimonas_sp.AAC.1
MITSLPWQSPARSSRSGLRPFQAAMSPPLWMEGQCQRGATTILVGASSGSAQATPPKQPQLAPKGPGWPQQAPLASKCPS